MAGLTTRIRHDALASRRVPERLPAGCLRAVRGVRPDSIRGEDAHLPRRVHQRERTRGGRFRPGRRRGIGRVDKVAIEPDTTAIVEFTADDSVVLTEGSRAVIRYDDLIGGRFLALQEGAGSTATLKPGDTIPMARTAPPWTSML